MTGSDERDNSANNPQHDDREFAARDKILDEALEILRGHFDGLVILGTWTLEDGSTAMRHRFDGNWHCQNGAASYFLKKRMAGADLEAADQHNSE
jgi:hypothetical protein